MNTQHKIHKIEKRIASLREEIALAEEALERAKNNGMEAAYVGLLNVHLFQCRKGLEQRTQTLNTLTI